MTRAFKIQGPKGPLNGTLKLDGSKSISNRALIISHLGDLESEIKNLSSSDDTQVLNEALSADKLIYNLGHAGTSYRFLTAALCLNQKTITLTGSKRMLERPIGVLVDALRIIGADIKYLGKAGFPPLSIGRIKKQLAAEITISGETSSQFISALLLIAPKLEEGLTLNLTGTVVSRPYIEMTLNLMAHYGVDYNWTDHKISIAPQKYKPAFLEVEPDWSAASYYYAMAAFAESCDLQLQGFKKESIQGDAKIVALASKFGIATEYEEEGIRILKGKQDPVVMLEHDFLECPDLAQTMSVLCAGLGVSGLFTGLETLKIKETDRVEALKKELSKFRVSLADLPVAKFSSKSQKQFYMLQGKAEETEKSVATYKDHRMALSFATLALLFPIIIENPEVVSKSYPRFWEDLKKLSFTIEALSV